MRSPPVQQPLTLDAAAEEQLYVQLVGLGLFATEPERIWREVAESSAEPSDGIRLMVVSESAAVEIVSTHAALNPRLPYQHVVDVRQYGTWRRLTWSDPPTEASRAKELARIGLAIRRAILGVVKSSDARREGSLCL